MRHPDGTIATSHLNRYTWGLPANIMLGVWRGVVTAVHWPEDPSSFSKTGLEVDVLFYDRQFAMNIPVAQYLNVGEGDVWTPQPAMRAKNKDYLAYEAGNAASFTEWAETLACNIWDLDGDHVLVAFVRGKNSDPVVIGRTPNPHRMYPPERVYQPPAPTYHHGRPTGFSRQIRHSNSTIGIDEGGNVYLEATAGGWPNLDPDREPEGQRQSVYVQAGGDGKVVIRAGSAGEESRATYIEIDMYGGVRVRLDPAATFRVDIGDEESTGKVAEAGAVWAELERLRQAHNEHLAWSKSQAKRDVVGECLLDFVGATPDVSSPKLVVPQQSQK